MRVRLDACVPRGLRDSLSSHEVRTAPEMGWGDLDNGDLLDAMTGQVDVLVTVDKRLPQEQRIADLPFGVPAQAGFARRLIAKPSLACAAPQASDRPHPPRAG